jgi:uncharacterized protein YxeA
MTSAALESYLHHLEELSMCSSQEREEVLRESLDEVKNEAAQEIANLLQKVVTIGASGEPELKAGKVSNLESELYSALVVTMPKLDHDTRNKVVQSLQATQKSTEHRSEEKNTKKAGFEQKGKEQQLFNYMVNAKDAKEIVLKIEEDDIPEESVSSALQELAVVNKQKAQEALVLLPERRVVSISVGALSIGNEGILHILNPSHAAELVLKQWLHDLGRHTDRGIFKEHKVTVSVQKGDTIVQEEITVRGAEKGEIFAHSYRDGEKDLEEIFKDFQFTNTPSLLLALMGREDRADVLAYLPKETLIEILSANYALKKTVTVEDIVDGDFEEEDLDGDSTGTPQVLFQTDEDERKVVINFIGDTYAAAESQQELLDIFTSDGDIWDEITASIERMETVEKAKKEQLSVLQKERKAKVFKDTEQEPLSIADISEDDLLGGL